MAGMSATHSQPSAGVTDAERALHRRGADLCRRRPNHFAAVVRYADELRAEGVEHHQAFRAALDAYDARVNS